MSETEVPNQEATLREWTDALAAPTAAPAGGAAAALSLALAAALVEMVGGLTRRRERYAAVHGEATEAAARAAALRAESLALATADATAFAGFERALALPRDTEAQRTAREEAKRASYREGAGIQHQLVGLAAETAQLAFALAERGLVSAAGDAVTALHLAGAAARSAAGAVRVNLAGEADDQARRMLDRSAALLKRVEELERRGGGLADRRTS